MLRSKICGRDSEVLSDAIGARDLFFSGFGGRKVTLLLDEAFISLLLVVL